MNSFGVVTPSAQSGSSAARDPALSAIPPVLPVISGSKRISDDQDGNCSISPTLRERVRERPPDFDPPPIPAVEIKARQPGSFGTASRWQIALEQLDYALQPIVNIHTGACDGCEALLRNSAELGFASIPALFNAAHDDGVLLEVDLALRAKAIHKFIEIPFHHQIMLFYNIDNRLLSSAATAHHSLVLPAFIRRFGIHPHQFVYEISERHDENIQILHDCQGLANIKDTLGVFRNELFRYAIDDFGAGFSGLQLLYHAAPDFLKIDRFFIAGMASDQRKQLFVSATVKMARGLGNNAVIAEGVETIEEFFACNQMGCDYVQGYLVQRPTTISGEIKESYPLISELQNRNRRHESHDLEHIHRQLKKISPITFYNGDGSMIDIDQVFEVFRRSPGISLVPVLNRNQEPIGVIWEKDLKEYVYSPFGREILRNRASAASHVPRFITRIPTVEIRTRVEHVLEVFSQHQNSGGALITEGGKYQGFLSTEALLQLLFVKNVEEARDQNPLTKLPGNFLINRYVAEGNRDPNFTYVYGYFDFDNFKPFNDTYGLRSGDRAIIMFAEILKETSNRIRCFIGHVGGDDFFIGFKLDDDQLTLQLCRDLISDLCRRFASDVVSVYNAADRKNGYISSYDRAGKPQRFPLLTVSAAMLSRPPGTHAHPLDETFKVLAELKKQAKSSGEKFAAFEL